MNLNSKLLATKELASKETLKEINSTLQDQMQPECSPKKLQKVQKKNVFPLGDVTKFWGLGFFPIGFFRFPFFLFGEIWGIIKFSWDFYIFSNISKYLLLFDFLQDGFFGVSSEFFVRFIHSLFWIRAQRLVKLV